MTKIDLYTGPKEQILPSDISRYENGSWVATAKIDGAWARVDSSMDGILGRFVSRTGKTFSEASADGLMGLQSGFRDCTLIGELETATQASTAVYERLGYRRFWIFDAVKILGHDIRKLPYIKRRELIELIYNKLDYILLVPQVLSGFSSFYNKIVSDGGEGIVLKRLDSLYESGKTDDWVRVKEKRTIDFYVIGTGKTESNNDNLQLGLRRNGKIERIQSLTMPKGFIGSDLVGKIIECEGMEVMKSGALRSAQFVRVRSDKEKCDEIYL